MFNNEFDIARLKAQLDWYKGESYAIKTVQMIQERIRELESGLESSKTELKILDTPV